MRTLALAVLLLTSPIAVFAAPRIAVMETAFGKRADASSFADAKAAGYRAMQMHSGQPSGVRKGGVDPGASLAIAGDPALLESWRKASIEQGVEIVSLCAGSLNKCQIWGRDREVAMRIAKQTIDGCHVLGVKTMLFPFFGPSKFQDSDEALNGVAGFMRELLPYAEKKGVVIGIEAPVTTERVLELMKVCGFPDHLKVYYDTGNLFELEDIYETIRKFAREHFCEIHIKAAGHAVAGQGKIDLAQLAAALDDSGYDGWLVYESNREGREPVANRESIEKIAAMRKPVAQPNVVVIIADDIGYADLAFLPQAPADVKKYGTPGFDRLAATGTYFANAYGTSPICSPSRAGMITGRFQQRWGNYWYNQGGLPQEELTIPEALRGAGYATFKIGKTHMNWGPKHFPTLHGFEEYLGFVGHTWDYIRLSDKDVAAYQTRPSFEGFGECQILGPMVRAKGIGTPRDGAEPVSYEDGFTTRIFTDEAVDFIKREKGGKPFYLHVAHNAVHMPTYVVEKTWAEKVGARYVPWDRDAEKWGYPYWEPEDEPHQVFHKKWGHMGEIDVEGRRCYLANLFALDHSITRVLDALEETGQRENTLVVFVSDNGGTINTYANNTPLNGWKYMFGEGGIRIPFLVSMPGTLPQGKVDKKAIVSTMDIFPTAAEMAGLEVPGNLDGKSLLPVLKGERENHHETLFWAKSRGEWVMRHGKWKLTNKVGWEHRDFKVQPNGDVVDAGEPYTYPDEPQLFDLESDIGETKNLIKERPEIAVKLRELHKTWNAQMGDPVRMKKWKAKPKKAVQR